MKFKILTAGQKLKNMRKKYGLSQKQIAGNDMTREFVSLVETNKSKLSKSSAENLLKNIKMILAKNGIEFSVSLDYLFETIDEQKEKILNQCNLDLKEFNISNYNENKFKYLVEEVEVFLIENGISFEYKITLYKEIVHIFFKNYDYSNAEIYLLKATSDATEVGNYQEVLELILDRIRLYAQSNNSKQEEILIRYAVEYYHEHNIDDHEILKKLYFNAATVYSNLNKFDKCIDYIDLLTKNSFQFSEIENLEIKNLYSNNLFINKQYDKAEKISLEILDIAIRNSYTDVVSKIYINLADIYTNLEKYEKAKKYLEKSVNLKHDYKYISKIDIYYSQLKLNIRCNNRLTIVDKNFNNLINSCKIENDSMVMCSAYKLMSDYYIKLNKDELLNSLILNLREEIKEKKLNVDNNIYSLLIVTLNYFKPRNKRTYEEIFTISMQLNQKNNI